MKNPINEAFGRHLAMLRMSKGFSQEQLAFECNLHRTYIGTLERGEKSATVETIFKLARGLNIEPKILLDY